MTFAAGLLAGVLITAAVMGVAVVSLVRALRVERAHSRGLEESKAWLVESLAQVQAELEELRP